jgi:hypothetical protein
MAYRWQSLVLAGLLGSGFGGPATAQKTASPVPVSTLTYADTADLALSAPIVAEVRIRRAENLKGPLAPGLAAGLRRYLIEADVMALIRGTQGLPPRISYIVDLAPAQSGKWPKLAKAQMVVFALPVKDRTAEIRLVAPDAQQPATPDLSARVRRILAEGTDASAPPLITGVGQAFHVPGALPGEGETQIFLTARDGRPVSLSVWREQGQPPRWAVSLGEIVDEGAEPPARDTLAWYRLACTLPLRLPGESTAELTSSEAQIAAEDYAVVMSGLGGCQRTRGKGNRARNS